MCQYETDIYAQGHPYSETSFFTKNKIKKGP